MLKTSRLAKAAGASAPAAFSLDLARARQVRKSRGPWSSLLCLILGCSFLTACYPGQPETTTYIFRGPTMGTSYSVKLVADEELSDVDQGEIRQSISQELERINAVMSTYLPDSEISRFNRHASLEPFPVSFETGQVVRAALDVGHRTRGAFDITIAPLVDAWGFGPTLEVPPKLPDDLIQAVLDQIGIKNLRVGEDSLSLSKVKPGLSCDLSGIAKGYAVDRVTEVLIERGFEHLLVDIGGEVRALGKNAEGAVWRLGIERPQGDPLERGSIQQIVPLDGLAMATSGDYRNYREVEGERFSHILDPRDGRPIRHRLASVSVVDEQCMSADAWATALMVLGPEEGYDLAAEQGFAAFFLIRDKNGGFTTKATEAFERLRGMTSN